MKGLDLSKFKKVSSDRNTTTLRHEHGHEIRLAHIALSPNTRRQLDRLPTHGDQQFESGGSVASDPSLESETPDVEYTNGEPRYKGRLLRQPEAYGNAKANEANKKNEKTNAQEEQYAEGTTDAPVGEEPNASDASTGQPVHITINNAPQPQDQSPTIMQRVGQAAALNPAALPLQAANFLGRAGNAMAPAASRMVDQGVQGFRSGVTGEQMPVGGEASAAADASQPTASQPMAPAAAPQDGMQTPPKLQDMPDLSAGQVYKQGMAGIQGEKAAAQGQARDTLKAQREHVNDLVQLQQEYQQNLREKMQDVTSAIQDFSDGHINPDHFMESKSAAGKVSTAIGLVLGGLGGGMLHQENAAAKFLNAQIDRDISAQKADMDKRHTLIGAYMKQYDSIHVAEQMARATELGLYSTKLEQAAAKAADPAAAARALQQSAALANQMLPLVQQAAVFHMASGGSKGVAQGDPAAYVPYIVPKEHQEAVYKEVERAQDTRRMGNSIMNAFDTAAKENTLVRRAGGLRGDPGSVLALRQAMQPTFKDLEGTVRQAAMDNTFTNVIPERGDTQHRIDEKRAALTDYLKSKSSAPRAKSFGIDLQRFGSTTTNTPTTTASSAPAEGATGTFQGKPVVFQGGRWTYRSQPTK